MGIFIFLLMILMVIGIFWRGLVAFLVGLLTCFPLGPVGGFIIGVVLYLMLHEMPTPHIEVEEET